MKPALNMHIMNLLCISYLLQDWHLRMLQPSVWKHFYVFLLHFSPINYSLSHCSVREPNSELSVLLKRQNVQAVRIFFFFLSCFYIASLGESHSHWYWRASFDSQAKCDLMQFWPLASVSSTTQPETKHPIIAGYFTAAMPAVSFCVQGMEA